MICPATIGTVRITEFQNLMRYCGFLMSTLVYWSKVTMSGISLRLDFAETKTLASPDTLEKICP